MVYPKKFNALILLVILLSFNIINTRNLRQSHKYKRVFVIVVDSMGIGAMPDSEKYGDINVDTLGHIAEKQTSFVNMEISMLILLGILQKNKLVSSYQICRKWV